MKNTTLLLPLLALGLGLSQTASAQSQTLFSNANVDRGIPAGGPYVPPGGLYDNEQTNGSTSLASQDSSGTLTARSADDFILPQGCATNRYRITQIRVQTVQADAAPQPIAIDLYNDNGSGTAPTPANAITPIFTVPQSSATALGPFGVGTTVSEVTFAPTNMTLNANTRYWISAFGTDAAANAASFNNFFGASNGAGATTDNGVIIAPGAGVATWTPVETVIGPPALAFSFAIDGTCQAAEQPVPANNHWALMALAGLLALVGVVLVGRRVG